MTLPACRALLPLLLSLVLATPANAAGTGVTRADQQAAAVQSALDLYARALMTKDRSAFDRVLHADLSYGHSSGLIETKAEAIQHVLGSTARWEAVTFSDTRIQVRGDTAYATGKVQFRQRGPSGKETVIDLVALHVFVKAKGQPGWQMIARQATRPPPAAAPAPAPAKR